MSSETASNNGGANGAQYVTRTELHAGLGVLRSELRADMAELRTEIKALPADVYQALASQTRWMVAPIVGAMTAQTAIFAAINYLMLKH